MAVGAVPTDDERDRFDLAEQLGSTVRAVGLFFGGIATATAGRVWDHHGSGRLGARMIIGSLALAVLFGPGYTLITQFAGTSA
jgi:hypothetical protein